MKRGRVWRYALLLAVVGMSGGCGGALKEPEVRLEGLRLGSIGLQGGLLYARIHVHNPNRFEIQAAAVEYDLDLGDAQGGTTGWIKLSEGIFEEEIRIPGRDSIQVDVPVRFSFGGVGGALMSLLETGTVEYRVRGSVDIRRPVRRDVPFRRQGVVSMSGIR
jgi:LEA14-like dessication related protein